MNANPGLVREVVAVRLRWASPRTALLLGSLLLSLLAVWAVLTVLTGDLRVTNVGEPAVGVAFALVGVVVARRQPGNVIGWIFLAVALIVPFHQDLKLYGLLAYRSDGHALPLSRLAVFWYSSFGFLPFLVGLPVILLFPDGRLASRRWRRIMAVYVFLSAFWVAGQVAENVSILGSSVTLDVNGNYTGTGPSGFAGLLTGAAWLVAAPLLLLLWLSFVGHQIAAWRRARGEQRQQLKWLTCGAACCVLAPLLIVAASASSSSVGTAIRVVFILAIISLPVSIGVGILKYRLYEIDRLISRTLSYAIVTVTLVGVFAGLVLLTTRVLPFSSPVGVAASTLAAAALFNPLRRRVQRLVDRRFNRARYDVEAVVAAFTARLRDAVDLDTVHGELLRAATSAVQPAHAVLWIKPPAERAT